MQHYKGWFLPSHEAHLQDWLSHPKNKDVILNGRVAYQGKKLIAAMAACTKFRHAVDIGGHVGFFSFNLAHKFEHVTAFEPVGAHRLCFEANVLVDEALAKKVTLHACALGKEEGSVSIHTSKGSSGDSYVKGAGDIPMHTLDSFGLGDVDLIKCDVEGFERNVMEGAEATIKKWKPVVLIEQKRQMSADRFGIPALGAVTLLESWGYRRVAEMSGDYLLIYP